MQPKMSTTNSAAAAADSNEANNAAAGGHYGGGSSGGMEAADSGVKPTIISVDGDGGGDCEQYDGGINHSHLQIVRSPVARTISNRSSVVGGGGGNQQGEEGAFFYLL